MNRTLKKRLEKKPDWNQLIFGSALLSESLEFEILLEEVNREQKNQYKVVNMNMLTKKSLVEKYGIKNAPTVVALDQAKEINRLKCTLDKEILKFSGFSSKYYSSKY